MIPDSNLYKNTQVNSIKEILDKSQNALKEDGKTV